MIKYIKQFGIISLILIYGMELAIPPPSVYATPKVKKETTTNSLVAQSVEVMKNVIETAVKQAAVNNHVLKNQKSPQLPPDPKPVSDPPTDPSADKTTADVNATDPNPTPVPATPSPPDPFTGLKGLKGNFDTDLFTGGGTFKYPVEIPSGRNGMTPSLSLNYSTFNTRLDSIVGYGWEMNNSYIYRSTNKGTDKLYTENTFTSSLFGSTEELVLTDSATGEYRPKVEGSFMVYHLQNNSWTATDTKGAQYLFGSTASTRQDNPTDTTKIYKWMLEKITDTNGNTMTFSYTKDQGQIYPDTISYTGNGSDPGIYKIKFNYAPRPYSVTMYTPSFGVTTAQRLSSIEIQVNLGSGYQTVYAYQLTYDDTDSKGLLKTIQLVSGTQTLPPTIFGYTSAGNPQYQPTGLLASIQTPYGGITTITYKPSTQYRTTAGGISNSKLPLNSHGRDGNGEKYTFRHTENDHVFL